ncbi:MAG TPA: non-homologous end-joining DNA ligase [Candidatus Acidoferrum sp.]|nr:non-homologous end-joining DNA ligase [Candidatus Acidoferrum sp.]
MTTRASPARAATRVSFRLRPMLATLVDAPVDRPGWIAEEKYDGIRLIAYKEGRAVSLITRNDIDRSADFPGVVSAIAKLPAPTLVLDGEVVIFDQAHVSRFTLLQRRDGSDEPVYVAFDCLYARGEDLRRRPLAERRRHLEREVRPGGALAVARRLPGTGSEAYEAARRLGLEGIILKDESSPYEDGARSRAWLKVKLRNEDEFVIGGYTAPGGARSHFGALLVGAWEGGRLRYAGKVGTGFTERMLADLMRRFRPLARASSPFADRIPERGATWLEPTLVAQLAFTERTRDGKLRHPTFLGLRDDKPARAVAWTA